MKVGGPCTLCITLPDKLVLFQCTSVGHELQEFSKAAKAVADEEKGSKIFTLSKTATDNFQLWEYGEAAAPLRGSVCRNTTQSHH